MTYPKEALAKYGPMNRRTCFVMMPFAPELTSVYRRIKDTLQAPPLNIACSRADDIRRPNIIDTILRSIAQSEYILADLTGLNANVFYELGIAHSTKEADKVVLLTQDLEQLPFDLRQLRCIPYSHSASGMRALKSELIKTFQQASGESVSFRLAEAETFALPTRLTGEARNLFELSVTCACLGGDGAKVTVEYKRRSLDSPRNDIREQHSFVGLHQPMLLEHVPWSLHFTGRTGDHALFVMERTHEAATMEAS